MNKKLLYKFKSCRSLSENIWPTRKITEKQKSILSKRASAKKKLSNYGLKLEAKRALSILYGKLSSNQYQKIKENASKLQGKIGNNFCSLYKNLIIFIIFKIFT